MLLSHFVPAYPSPTVSSSPFSTSASLFLPCHWVHQYHFSRFHINVLIYGIFLLESYILIHTISLYRFNLVFINTDTVSTYRNKSQLPSSGLSFIYLFGLNLKGMMTPSSRNLFIKLWPFNKVTMQELILVLTRRTFSVCFIFLEDWGKQFWTPRVRHYATLTDNSEITEIWLKILLNHLGTNCNTSFKRTIFVPHFLLWGYIEEHLSLKHQKVLFPSSPSSNTDN